MMILDLVDNDSEYKYVIQLFMARLNQLWNDYTKPKSNEMNMNKQNFIYKKRKNGKIN